ncbi:MAG: aminopeptidase P family protein [Candidatus Competibacterales bacterium]
MADSQRPSFQRLRNGAKAPATFSPAEYSRRITALREVMVHHDLDATLFTSIHNVNYYSDFLYCAFGRPYGLVVTQDQVIPIAALIDYGQPWRRAVADEVLSYSDWQRDNFHRALKALVPNSRRLGVEYDHLTLQRRDQLLHAYPGVDLCDVGEACMQLRLIKSAEEQALIRAGAAIADEGGAAAVEALAEGVPEYEVALHATAAMTRAIAQRFPHAELRDTWCWFQSGINTDGAHNPLTSRPVQVGDILSLNCFPMIAGYYTALERTLFLGHCSDAHLRPWQINLAVHRAGLAALGPGVRCGDVAESLNEIYREHGVLEHRTFGYGHSFGVLCHYYGREAALELREDVDTVLAPGMVVSMEPMITIPEGLPGSGGYREHDILLITEDGAENLTGFPLGPEHNIIPHPAPPP